MAGGWQINLNDAFCHGHTIENNLLFNWVRETQDHGPINTWNRAAYMHVGKDGEPTNVPEWTHISHVRGTMMIPRLIVNAVRSICGSRMADHVHSWLC